ncbi:MAG: VCBS repeat-containing protein [Pseudomonadales bacterium]|nr:VCBS repeat-containing protein [Pseudomonadales bacterium]
MIRHFARRQIPLAFYYFCFLTSFLYTAQAVAMTVPSDLPTINYLSYDEFTANPTPNSKRHIATADVNNNGSYTLSWAGAGLYVSLQTRNSSGSWVTLVQGVPPTSSYSVTGKGPGIYEYRLHGCLLYDPCPYNGSGIYVTVADPADGPVTPAPENGVLRNINSLEKSHQSTTTDGNYNLGWTSRPRINYLLQVETESGEWTSLFEGYTSEYQAQTYNISDQSIKGYYRYRLLACGYPASLEDNFVMNCTEISEHTVIDLRAPSPLSGIQAPAISNSPSYELSWSVSPTANMMYQLEERNGIDGTWTIRQNDSSRKYTATGRSNGIYYYRVRVCDVNGLCSAPSPAASVLVESQNLTVTDSPIAGDHFSISVPADVVQGGAYNISWVIPNGAVFAVFGSDLRYFELQERVGSGEWHVRLKSSSATSHMINNQPDGEYHYRIKHCWWINQWDSPKTEQCYTDDAVSVLVDGEVNGINDVGPVSSSEVGSTGGSFRVDQQGAAGYAIAIADLPGLGGVTPQMSLNYNSGAGNGYAGVGWSVGGLSSISRCRQSYEADLRNRTVMLDDEDRFCLDGARLVKVAGSNEYGEAGNEYRTEIDQSLRVRSVTSATGKLYFKVWRKDGSISEYGNSTDSAVVSSLSVGSIVNYWAQNKFSDSAGNYMLYQYLADTDGDFRIDQVKYTGHDSTDSPNASIKFKYSNTRSDTNIFYGLGSKNTVSRRLDSIEVREGSDLFRQYNLRYGLSKGTQRNLLRSVQECVSDTNCLPATKFNWHEPDRVLQGDQVTGEFGVQKSYLGGQTIDVNGDGKQDWLWLYHNGDEYRFRLSYSDGTSLVKSSFSVRAFSQAREAWHVIDYNNDGYQDLVYATGSRWKVHLSNGATLSSSAIDIGVPSTSSSKAIFSDLNGDGLVDMLYHSGDNDIRIRYLKKNSSWSADQPYSYGKEQKLELITVEGAGGNIKADFKKHPPMDLNGDGRVDLLLKVIRTELIETTYSKKWILLTVDPTDDSTYPTRFTHMSSAETEIAALLPVDENAENFRLIDINSDGLTDIFSKIGDEWFYRLNNGTPYGLGSSFEDAMSVGKISKPKKMQFADLNGDRMSDLVQICNYNDQQALCVRYWNGRGYGAAMLVGPSIGDWRLINPDHTMAFLDIDGDSYADLLAANIDQNNYTIYFNRFDRTPQDLIHRITNGLGAKTEIDYTTLTNDQDLIYTPGHGASEFDWGNGSPVFDLNSPMYVVSRVSSSAPTETDSDHMAEMEYFYQGLRIQAGGRGSLGFEYLTTYDPQSGVLVDTRYRQDFPFAGMPLQTVKYHLDTDTLLSVADNEWQQNSTAGEAIYPYIANSVETSYDSVSGELLGSVTTTNTYDDGEDKNYANLSMIKVEIRDAQGSPVSSTTTNNEYVNHVSTGINGIWHLGRLEKATVQHERPGQTTIPRTAKFDYDSITRILNKEIIEPDGGIGRTLTTEYGHDVYGQRTSTTVSGDQSAMDTSTDITTRTSGVRMDDDDHRFVKERYNSMGHVLETVTDRDTFGRTTEANLINGNQISTRYDAWGRTTSTTSNIGVSVSNQHLLCENAVETCPLQAVYLSIQTSSTGQKSIQYFDVLGREVRKSKLGFNGETIQSDTYYDAVGRVAKISSPYVAGASTIYWTKTQHDPFGRVIRVTLPDESASSISYNGYETTTTNALGQTRTEITNALGETVRVIDAKLGVLTNTYDAAGNLIKVTGADGQIIEMVYDLLGRKTIMDDPDKGHWKYTYNALGELVTQTNAKGQVTTMTYDVLGRMKTRISADEDSVWVYDSAANGLGQLDYVENTLDGYKNEIVYDQYGRPNGSTTAIDGIPYLASSTFKPGTNQIASKTGADGREIRNKYNDYGYLERSWDVISGKTIHEVMAVNAAGQITEFRAGNGMITTRAYQPDTGRILSINTDNGDVQDLLFSYDEIGNLKTRRDHSGTKNMFEAFDYDELNRLEEVRTYAPGSESSIYKTTTVDYDAGGNITNKSDIGDYTYGANNAGPHAVTNAGGTTYSYDANGNQTAGNGRSLSYNSFDKLVEAKKGNDHTTTFYYGASRSRYKRVDDAVGGQTTTLYLGNVEKIDRPNESVKYRSNLGAMIITSAGNGSAGEIQYIFKDQQGSIDVIVDSSGATTDLSFDAWGKRRRASNWNVLDATEIATDFIAENRVTTRGYTGHEQLDEMGLIHMNGRIYDPSLGRVLQADPFIQAPGNSQSYNRYTYVINNPLAYTDPSGYFFSLWVASRIDAKLQKPLYKYLGKNPALAQFAQIVGTAVSTAYCGPCSIGFNAQFSMNMTYAQTGSFTAAYRSAAIAGVSSAAFYVIGGIEGLHPWQRVAAHGMTGGIMAELQGGKFGHGFAAAGFTAMAGNMNLTGPAGQGPSPGGVIVSSVVGGTASVLSGGKFGNGAVTGAFSYILNDSMPGHGDEEASAKSFAAICESVSQKACSYEQYNLERIPKGAKMGRKHCYYTCSVTYQNSDGFWAEPLDIEVYAPSNEGYGNAYSWDNQQRPYGGTQVQDPRFPNYNIPVLVTKPFVVTPLFKNKYEGMHTPILEKYNYDQ